MTYFFELAASLNGCLCTRKEQQGGAVMQGAARAALEPLSGNSRSDPSAGAETKRLAEWAPGARDAPPPDPDTASPINSNTKM